MKLITLNQTIDFTSLGFLTKTELYPTPSANSNSYYVIDRDGEIEFTSGLKNKPIRVTMIHKANASLATRRYLFGQIKQALLEGGYLIFDYEPQIKWRARVLNGADVKFNITHDVISIEFDVSPYGVNSTIEDNFAWVGASNETIVVENLGNRPSNPTIKITGTGNISLTANGKTLTITGLSGTINIDCQKMIVYDDLNANKMTLTNATFLELLPGENDVIIAGTADLEFIDKSRWV